MVETPENQLFHKLVMAYAQDRDWKEGSYAHGLLDAFVMITGAGEEVVLDQLYDAVNEERQRSHDEMLDSLEREERHA